jgi:hypothetical protein
VGSPRIELQTTSNTASAHTSTTRARRAATALQRATAGRHAHDEHGDARSMLAPTPRAEVDTAVKNLRIAGSAVLLLNLREVRRFHFCSVSVAV